MSAHSRRKGVRGEREAVGLLQAHGWTYARRTLQSGAEGDGDIANGPRGIAIEVKRHAGRLDLPQALQQARDACHPGQHPMVLHRRDGETWLATLPAELVLELLAVHEQTRTAQPAAPALFDASTGSAHDPWGQWS